MYSSVGAKHRYYIVRLFILLLKRNYCLITVTRLKPNHSANQVSPCLAFQLGLRGGGGGGGGGLRFRCDYNEFQPRRNENSVEGNAIKSKRFH